MAKVKLYKDGIGFEGDSDQVRWASLDSNRYQSHMRALGMNQVKGKDMDDVNRKIEAEYKKRGLGRPHGLPG